MAAQINVKVDVKAFKLEMRVFAKQIPFATARAVNTVTTKAQANIRKSMESAFIMRRKAWVQNSIKVKPFATKETLSATISVSPQGGDSRDVLSQHETWFSKVSKSGGMIAVPISNGAVRSDEKKVIPTAKRPRNLKNAFKLTDKDDGQQYIMVRKGRGKNAQTLPAYQLFKRVKLKPRLRFQETVNETVQKEWEGAFNEAWRTAVDTALK